VALGVYLFIRSTSKFHGVFAGLIASVGVPYTLIYVTVPYIGYPASFLLTMLVLLQAFFILEKGPSLLRLFLFGLVIGSSLYIAKQCIPGIAAACLALVLFHTPAYNWRKLLNPFGILLAAFGFLIGYAPEIYYRTHYPRIKDFSGISSPGLMWSNFKELQKGLMAYFNAHPFSRIPTDIYFYHSIPFWGLRCASAADVLFLILGIGTLFFMLWSFKKAFVEKNIGLFLLAALILINMAVTIISKVSIGNIFNTRRYMHVSAISLSFFTAYCLTYYLVTVKSSYLKWALMALLFFFPLKNAWDQYSLLGRPDGLRELRWIIQDMQNNGYNRGISEYGPNYSINALSNEQVIIGNRDGDLIPEYATLVSQADKIAVLGYKGDPVVETVSFNGNNYRRIGDAHLDEMVQWTPFQKIK
jgi:hypothetical protein